MPRAHLRRIVLQIEMLRHDGNAEVTFEILKILGHMSRQSNGFQSIERCRKILVSTRNIHDTDEHRNRNYQILSFRIADIVNVNTTGRNRCRRRNVNPPKISQQKIELTPTKSKVRSHSQAPVHSRRTFVRRQELEAQRRQIFHLRQE